MEIRPLAVPPYRGFRTASREGEAAAAALEDFPGFLRSPEAETLQSGRNQVIAVRLSPDRDAVVKIFGTRGVQKWKTLLLPSKGLRAWKGALALVENGFETAEPIAVFERRRGGIAVESVFISGRVRGGREIREHFLQSSEIVLRRLLSSLAPVLARLHGRGIVHRDLSDGNILVFENEEAAAAPAGGGFRFLFLDTNRVRRRRPGIFNRARNLVRLGVPPGLQPFFLDQYAAAAGGRFRRRRFGLSYRISKRVFISWLAFKKRLRLRALARRLRIQ